VELMASPGPRRLPRVAKLLVAAVGAAGALTVALRLPSLSSWSTADLVAMCALVGVTLVGESFTLKIRYGAETKHVSGTEAAYAAALLSGMRPSVLTVAVGLGIGAADVARGTAPHKTVLNVGSWLAAITGAELAFGALRGNSPAVAVSAAMTVFFAINASSVLGAIALATGRSFGQVLRPIAALEVAQAAGNLALGGAAAAMWSAAPAAVAALALVPAAAFVGYRFFRPARGRTTIA